MLDVVGAQLWAENFPKFEHFRVHKVTDTHYMIRWQEKSGGKADHCLFDCYFHLEGAIIEVDHKLQCEVGASSWDRFPYSDPAYPFNVNSYLLDLFGLYLRGCRPAIGQPLFEELQVSIDLLRAENQRLHQSSLTLGVAG